MRALSLLLCGAAVLIPIVFSCPSGCRCQTNPIHGIPVLGNRQGRAAGCETISTCPCGTIMTGTSFDCTFFTQENGAIGETGWLKSIPSSARRVDLYGCGLKQIPDDAFSHLTSVRVLNLEYNGLTKVDAGAVRGMSKLKVLWLTGHHLRQDDAEHDLMEPQKNEINSIHADAFETNPNLTVLLLHHNKLSLLPDNVFKTPAKSLRVVKLSDNALNLSKKSCLAGLEGVKQLDLEYDSGDRLEDWMYLTNHYLDDQNGDKYRWWSTEEPEDKWWPKENSTKTADGREGRGAQRSVNSKKKLDAAQDKYEKKRRHILNGFNDGLFGEEEKKKKLQAAYDEYDKQL